LSQDDRLAITRAGARQRELPPRHDLVREGDTPKYVHLILDGWACRYKTLPDGRRQILSLFVPGDFCDLNIYILKEMDHNIASISRLKVAHINREEMDELTVTRPRITQALWWAELVNAAVQREWTLNVGQRGAYARISHLFLELFFRLRAVGLSDADSCHFPITQSDIADATGLTAVHVNRMLQELREDGLVELDRKRLRLPDLDRLIDTAMFNPNYLHLGREGRHLDAND
jgi:CRP-like cAMP-binding protein